MSCSSDGDIDSEAGGSTEGDFEDPWIGNSPTILPRVLAFGASIQPSHERRQPVFPVTLSYEAEHTRGLLERSQRAAFLGSDYDDDDWFVNSEGQVDRVLTPSDEFYRRCAEIEAEEELLDSDGSEIVLTPSESRASSIHTITSMDDPRFTGLADERAENYIGSDEDEEMMDSEGEGHFGDSDPAPEDDDDLAPDEPQPPFNPIALGLKEIGGLAHFRVSSYKPGNGVEELISDDTDRYWQSDGIQPHRLTMTFVKCVEIRALRFHVDYHQDESYTPTRIMWYAGTSEHDLLHFATSNLVNPEGWTDVPITGAGGGEDGNSLMAWVVQMQITENHQNGKDTHIRGVKVYGFDEQLRAAGPTGLRDDVAAAAGSSLVGGTAAAGGPAHPEFRVDDTKTGEENEEAFKAYVRSIESAREFQPGDPSGTASSLDFMEDLQLR